MGDCSFFSVLDAIIAIISCILTAVDGTAVIGSEIGDISEVPVLVAVDIPRRSRS